jgi:hypothetical protein
MHVLAQGMNNNIKQCTLKGYYKNKVAYYSLSYEASWIKSLFILLITCCDYTSTLGKVHQKSNFR